MIDFNAIDSEIAICVGSAGTFKSVSTGRIRQTIPVNQLPSLDVSSAGHETNQDANRTYTIPVIIVISRRDYDRDANAAAFKDFVRDVCAALEDKRGWTTIDVVRNIRSELGEESTGDGKTVRTVIIRLNALAH